MPDWTKSMQQTFEYYTVNPNTWMDESRIDNIISCSITRDSTADTLGSISLQATGQLQEGYIRIYLVTIQSKKKERTMLGTYLIQTPSYSFNGKVAYYSIDGYTPLIELTEKYPDLGFFIGARQIILDRAKTLVIEHSRAICDAENDATVLEDDFVAEASDNWLTYIKDLLSCANYSLNLDTDGRVVFEKNITPQALAPTWEYTTDNSSILQSEISVERDLFGVPNVVEIVKTNGMTNEYVRVVNDNPNSPLSVQRRGREIVYREVDPDTIKSAEQYAKDVLAEQSTLEYKLEYTHGYCPAKVGDCVVIDYPEAGLNRVRAKIISQTIDCATGCQVTETARITTNLWQEV